MTIKIVANTISDSENARRAERAILDGIGDRPEEELWGVSIFEPQENPGYFVSIEGPAGLRWNHQFSEEEGQSASLISEEVKKGVRPGESE